MKKVKTTTDEIGEFEIITPDMTPEQIKEAEKTASPAVERAIKLAESKPIAKPKQ